RLHSLLRFSTARPAAHPCIHSFPTRRSSDLGARVREAGDGYLPEDVLGCRPVPPLGQMLAVGDARRPVAAERRPGAARGRGIGQDRKSTRLNSSHVKISYAVFCLKKQKKKRT